MLPNVRTIITAITENDVFIIIFYVDRCWQVFHGSLYMSSQQTIFRDYSLVNGYVYCDYANIINSSTHSSNIEMYALSSMSTHLATTYRIQFQRHRLYYVVTATRRRTAAPPYSILSRNANEAIINNNICSYVSWFVRWPNRRMGGGMHARMRYLCSAPVGPHWSFAWRRSRVGFDLYCQSVNVDVLYNYTPHRFHVRRLAMQCTHTHTN